MEGTKYRALVLSGKKKVAVEMLECLALRPGQVRVRLGAGGVCGSDLHYYKDFGNVGFTLKNPIVMGHEASGTVVETGPDVKDLKVGDKVALNPVNNCGICMACRRGEANLCINKRFPCSAMNYPHIHGFFREYIETDARLCVKVPESTDLARLAFAEPLSCSLHAIRQPGELFGKNVLVTGSGPIGVLAAAAAKAAGAARVTITDIADEPLAIALKMGADQAVNTKSTAIADAVEGEIDVAVDASGAPSAIVDCMKILRKGGSMVQLGSAPATDIPVPWVTFTTREIKVFGSIQFHVEFELAVKLLTSGRIDPMPMLSRQFSFEQAEEAFAIAADRTQCMKIQFIL